MKRVNGWINKRTVTPMNKKRYIVFGIFGFLLLIIFLMNYRYPFMVQQGGNWSVGFQKTGQISLDFDLRPEGIITHQFVDSLIPREISYIADPFFIKKKDIFYLFVELKGKANADIALFKSSNGETYEYKGIVLDEPFHLSYPQIFRYREDFFMLPETKGANNVLLYQAERFPYHWKVHDTLIKNRALKDPSILISEELNLIIAVDDNLQQYMFTADSLHGKWTEVKNFKPRWGNESRPGGRFTRIGEDWYLPLQNHSQGYGTGISLYKLLKAEDGFEFKLAEKMFLRPQKEIKWFERGMHHLDIQKINDSEYYMVYDGDRTVEGKKDFQYKRTIKWNLVDLYNYFQP